MFASRSLTVHAGRGAIGLGAIVAAIALGHAPGVAALVASLALAAVALVALRGCPVCWTIGLVATVRARLRPTPAPAAMPIAGGVNRRCPTAGVAARIAAANRRSVARGTGGADRCRAGS